MLTLLFNAVWRPFLPMPASPLDPTSRDTFRVLLVKALKIINEMIVSNGGNIMDQPSYFPEGSEPKNTDSESVLLQKIVGALRNLQGVLTP